MTQANDVSSDVGLSAIDLHNLGRRALGCVQRGLDLISKHDDFQDSRHRDLTVIRLPLVALAVSLAYNSHTCNCC